MDVGWTSHYATATQPTLIYLGVQFDSPIVAGLGGLGLVGSLIIDAYILVTRNREQKQRKNRNYVIS